MCFRSLQVVLGLCVIPFQTPSVTELLSKLASRQRSGNSISCPTQATSCTGQRARYRLPGFAKVGGKGFQSSPSKPDSSASTFRSQICRTGKGVSLQRLSLGQHMFQGGALQFVRPQEQTMAEQDKQRLELVSALPKQALLCWIPHSTA